MNFEQQLLFFFSALGAFNGLFLSVYFAFFLKNRSRATYFLAALIFVISVRVTKSVFLTFYDGISVTFVQIGLTACFLIGPFLYLYVRETKKTNNEGGWQWLWHVAPFIVAMTFIGIYYPYNEYWEYWRRTSFGIFGMLLFTSWLVYVLMSVYETRTTFKKAVTKGDKLNSQEIWLLNVVIGNVLIWLAYNTTQYTSYIVGAISFSFTLYISFALWFFRKKKTTVFSNDTAKYGNKKIGKAEAASIARSLQILMLEKELYKNPNLKLGDVSSSLGISPHSLSQYLNENLGKSFSTFINEYRIMAAEEMLKSNELYTIEAIGNECGFNSKSTFFTTFKKITDVTPAKYKKENS